MVYHKFMINLAAKEFSKCFDHMRLLSNICITKLEQFIKSKDQTDDAQLM
uniref:Uncharacterized protein n=1 Tax=Nelumbo nucifera TaxID=4432 RepID=A0A822XDV4_NELNU|nr:TPA_asm: hypothetical protein HUJ06_019973 [Nelumbo nucifera]